MHKLELSDYEMVLLRYAINAARVDEYEFCQGSSPRYTALNELKDKLDAQLAVTH